MGNFKSRAKNGYPLKCNAAVIKDEKDKLIGFVCINYDISYMQKIEQSLNKLFDLPEEEHQMEENYSVDLWSIINQIMEQHINEKKKAIHLFTKDDRMDIIKAFSLLKEAFSTSPKFWESPHRAFINIWSKSAHPNLINRYSPPCFSIKNLKNLPTLAYNFIISL